MDQDYAYHLNKNDYNIPEKYSHHLLKVLEWLKLEASYVTKGEALITLGYETSYGNKETLTHYASDCTNNTKDYKNYLPVFDHLHFYLSIGLLKKKCFKSKIINTTLQIIPT